jgi:hypothetical protein
VNAAGKTFARWATTRASRRADRNNDLVTFEARTLYNKPTRHQSRALECLLHGADSPPIKTPDILQTASKVSQSQSSTPIDIQMRQSDRQAILFGTTEAPLIMVDLNVADVTDDGAITI